MQRTVHLLGVPIDAVTAGEAVRMITGFLGEQKQRHVATPNSEMLVAASRDAAFRKILSDADLRLPDSAGLLLMARWTGQRLPERVTGVDTVQAVCRELVDESLFLLGAVPGVAQRAAKELQRQNPKLQIAGTFAGSPRAEDAPAIIRRINEASPALLLVAFGAPAQDKWIAEHLSKMPSVRVAMGVGGTFDFLAGVQMRAPSLLRQLHLEWLWRVIREPRRMGRIWRAVGVFPWLVLRYGKGAPEKKSH
jgi:N-acetylglucosaminyldiphosphoundecaprenol N-acetyl-beta-D-mannosaminyltransferase